MADREKVITGLTECIHLYEYPDDWDVAGCVVCPYRPNGKGACDTTIPIRLLKDALELLKEQEPAHVDTVYSDEFGNALLCECGCMWVGAANSTMNYCPGCGKELK